MKKALAVLFCITVISSALSACGSSGNTTSQSPVTEESASIPALTESMVESATSNVPAAVEDASSSSEIPTSEAENLAEASWTTVSMSNYITEDGIKNLLPADDSRQLDITEVEGNADDKGLNIYNGELYEYKAFLTASTADYIEFAIVYYDPYTSILTDLADIFYLYKSAGWTESDIRNIDLSEAYPGFYNMDFANAYLFDRGEYYELDFAFTDLDKDKNIETAIKYGLITLVDGYTYGTKIDGVSIVYNYKLAGYKELTDYELSQYGIQP